MPPLSTFLPSCLFPSSLLKAGTIRFIPSGGSGIALRSGSVLLVRRDAYLFSVPYLVISVPYLVILACPSHWPLSPPYLFYWLTPPFSLTPPSLPADPSLPSLFLKLVNSCPASLLVFLPNEETD